MYIIPPFLSPSFPFSFSSLSLLPLSLLPFFPQVCVQTMEMLIAGQHVPEENLVLLGQLPHGRRQFYSALLSILLPMRCDPVVTLLTLQKSQQEEVSLEKLFKQTDEENSVEVCNSINRQILCLGLACCLGLTRSEKMFLL